MWKCRVAFVLPIPCPSVSAPAPPDGWRFRSWALDLCHRSTSETFAPSLCARDYDWLASPVGRHPNGSSSALSVPMLLASLICFHATVAVRSMWLKLLYIFRRCRQWCRRLRWPAAATPNWPVYDCSAPNRSIVFVRRSIMCDATCPGIFCTMIHGIGANNCRPANGKNKMHFPQFRFQLFSALRPSTRYGLHRIHTYLRSDVEIFPIFFQLKTQRLIAVRPQCHNISIFIKLFNCKIRR